jgi:hypothetical protein
MKCCEYDSWLLRLFTRKHSIAQHLIFFMLFPLSFQIPLLSNDGIMYGMIACVNALFNGLRYQNVEILKLVRKVMKSDKGKGKLT